MNTRKQYASTGRKPYYVAWTRQGETVRVFESHLLADCEAYANERISQGHLTERIEIFDYTGPLRAVYDKCWKGTTFELDK